MDKGDVPSKAAAPIGRGRGALARLLANRGILGGLQQQSTEQPLPVIGRGRGRLPNVDDGSSSSGVGTASSPSAGNVTAPSSDYRSHRGSFLKSYLSSKSADSDRGLDLHENTTEPSVVIGRGRGKLLEEFNAKLTLNPGSQISTRDDSKHQMSEVSSVITKETECDGSKRSGVVEELKTLSCSYLGTSGNTINVVSNYIQLTVEPRRGVFEYEVIFSPDLDSRGLRINLLNQHLQELGGVKTFDGVTLYLPIKLDSARKEFMSLNPVDETQVLMTVIFKRQKKLGECIHLYNVLLKRIMSNLDLVCFKRQHFDPSAPKMLPQHKLEVWPGYVTAVDEYEGGIMLCLDISHRVLRQTTVLEFLRTLVQCGRGNLQDAAKKALIGSYVLTRYNNRSYRIDDIAFDMSPTSSFENSSGETITFLNYYKKQYGIDILDIEQPLLISLNSVKVSGKAEPVENKMCIIPELSYLTGLTEENRNDFRLMKDIATFTKITPNQRVYGLKKFVDNVNNNKKSQELLSSWGLSLKNECVQLKARSIAPEDIRFGGGHVVSATFNADWGRASTNSSMLTVVNINKWILFYTQRDHRYMNDFKDCIKRCGPPMGMTIVDPVIVGLNNDRTETFIDAIHKTMRSTPDIQLLVFIFPTSRDDRYAAVKKLCCVEYGIASQVINSRTISKPDKIRSVVQKITLQINCKLGGSLWSVSIPLRNCMICGIDTYHDPTRKGKSVIGFVSSMNQNCTKYYSNVSFQYPHEELGQCMQNSFRIALKRYFDFNGTFPERVIFFRDGLGDGQLELCQNVEINMIEQCFNNTIFEKKPLLTFIVVQKRINTRIMAVKGNQYDNPGPGTIVDHTVTRKSLYDFFLVPQCVRQGTVSPTHYIVLRDTANMKPDHVQRLSFKMCHMYYNWTGTVRVPACCQYAHKLAYLIGQSVREKPSEKLVDRLYYL